MSGNVKKYVKDKGHESINRNMLQDEQNLSLQAIGLLANLTSYPDNWVLYKTELYKRFAKNGRTSVGTAWDELVENNYIIQFKKRNGKKDDYTYYHSQVPFTEGDIKEIEKIEGISTWDGKLSRSDSDSNKWTVDFGQSILDSPKSTDKKFTRKDVHYENKDLDTIDTSSDLKSKKSSSLLSREQKEKKKKEYIENAFYSNADKIPENISEMLSIFSPTPEEAEMYYNIILLAKKRASKDSNQEIWLEDEPDLIQEVINTFSRSVRLIEKSKTGKEPIKNPNGYLFKAIYELLIEEMNQSHRSRSEMTKEFEAYLNNTT